MGRGEELEAGLGGLLLRSTRARLYDRLTDGVAGVDATTYPVLSGLARTGAVTVTALAADVGLDRTVASRHASRLVETGLVERTGDPADARAAVLALTSAGRAAVRALRRRLVRELDGAFADWSDADVATLVAGLERLASLRR